MDISADLASLPPSPSGYVRVVRVEGADDPMLGGNLISSDGWYDLPTPQGEGYRGEVGVLDRWSSTAAVCAALPHQFQYWWGHLDPYMLYANSRRLVVLDVPTTHLWAGYKQAVINRKEALLVKVLH